MVHFGAPNSDSPLFHAFSTKNLHSRVLRPILIIELMRVTRLRGLLGHSAPSCVHAARRAGTAKPNCCTAPVEKGTIETVMEPIIQRLDHDAANQTEVAGCLEVIAEAFA